MNTENTMSGEKMMNEEQTFIGMDAETICDTCYGKKLDCKKSIIEYIEKVKILSKDEINSEQIEESYAFIEKSIEDMKAVIKPNTILQLKKELDAKLWKFAPKKSNVPDNYFLKFFTQAYPKNKRYKDYTWVLMDFSKISDDQILHTLKYISSWCLKNKLQSYEKKDIVEMMNKLVVKGNLKYINQVRSLEGLMRALRAKVFEDNGTFYVELKKNKTK